MELVESTFLTSGYTRKLQSSRQYGTGTKQKYRPVEQDREPGDRSMHLWALIFDEGNKSTRWRKNSLFPMSGVGKTGQLHVKQ